ncbi:unnamed protein product [Gongylonema pulchrum]|uniref:Uncharacterized protein n=1 Tax=Gongylonema pulchrum TaxID=637853 RepID=A0A183ERT7_9BILA|nr:unnamed protein product [Gongylonema pulchrum]
MRTNRSSGMRELRQPQLLERVLRRHEVLLSALLEQGRRQDHNLAHLGRRQQQGRSLLHKEQRRMVLLR